MKRNIFIALSFLLTLLLLNISISYATDWKTIAKNITADYQGKIISIEQLNSSTCWAVLSSRISNSDAVKIAENIGYYVRNSTGGIRGDKPSVHVFVSDKRIATARPSGSRYIVKLSIEDWNRGGI